MEAKVRVPQRTLPDPPLAARRAASAHRRRCGDPPRGRRDALPSPRAPASDAGAPCRGDRGRARPSAPPEGRVTTPPSARVDDQAATPRRRTRAPGRPARARSREGYFSPSRPPEAARARRPRRDDAERRAPGALDGLSARRRSVIHRRCAAAAGRRAGLCFSQVFPGPLRGSSHQKRPPAPRAGRRSARAPRPPRYPRAISRRSALLSILCLRPGQQSRRGPAGRYAARRVIVKNYDEGTPSRPYGHALCAASRRAPAR